MWLKWLPWRMILRNAAHSGGFLDPIDIVSKLERFSQPSEVAAPIQLLRSGVVLHARGLINGQAIQHNLDWVWPYWVECQFDPNNQSFVPRAFSVTHINLTHRNWTAVGIPDFEELPIVDPRGLVTPFLDGWSIDGWIIDPSKTNLIPSRLPHVSQNLRMDDGLSVVTESSDDVSSLLSKVYVTGSVEAPICRIQFKARTKSGTGALVVALRPYNPEGISFLHDIDLLNDHQVWRVNNKNLVHLNTRPDQHVFSYYRKGDVFHRIPCSDLEQSVRCRIGLATAAAQYNLIPDESREVSVEVPILYHPLTHSKRKSRRFGLKSKFKQHKKNIPHSHQTVASVSHALEPKNWHSILQGKCKLNIPDERMKFLYDAALRTVVLHSPGDVYPGPYTYKRFWFRDAAFILYAMLCVGFTERVKRVIDGFSSRQTSGGYFLSQDGEWDSNGEALWIIEQYCRFTRNALPKTWKSSVDMGGRWIMHKRMSNTLNARHKGLFPPGFSAEHLGPNDYYYWDDFWGVAGLHSAAYLTERFGNKDRADHFRVEAGEFMDSIEKSLEQVKEELQKEIIPASPYRRMDPGAIGSIVVDYPLKLWGANDIRVQNTVKHIYDNYFVQGGFFQDMTHSGINPYLTLHVAQVLLRSGDSRYFNLIKTVADLASSTGQWPEAIHPHTKGGCMGDGQHVWAAAEWIMMIRNLFVREEARDNKLILCSGVPEDWLIPQEEISFGWAPTIYGSIKVSLRPIQDGIDVAWDGEWFGDPPIIEIRLPGFEEAKTNRHTQSPIFLERRAS